MIQRIQSVFLLFVILGMAAFLIFPFWEKFDPSTGSHVIFSAFSLHKVDATGGEPVYYFYPYNLCGVGASVSVILAIIEIFNFKSRLTQIKIGLANSILMSLVLFFSAWLSLKAQQNFFPEIKGVFKLGLFAPVVGMIFNSLANRFIKRDEDRVRAADRIR
jgi:glucan phosphoethanolaminetransferase (alkaline phosphatase superfamily)